jgi:hypothetical protein
VQKKALKFLTQHALIQTCLSETKYEMVSARVLIQKFIIKLLSKNNFSGAVVLNLKLPVDFPGKTKISLLLQP